jgi:hypothetical protein
MCFHNACCQYRVIRSYANNYVHLKTLYEILLCIRPVFRIIETKTMYMLEITVGKFNRTKIVTEIDF